MTDAPSSAWSREDILGLFALPFNELLFQAHAVLRENWPEGTIHLSSLLSVKTGGCVEDCGYCAQSAKNKTGLPASSLLSREEVRAAARKAKASGSKRFCMSAAWRALKDRDIDQVAELVADVKSLGLETCLTLGMVSEDQARKLRKAGLDYYNHNVDSSPEYYAKVVTTRAYSDRLDTLNAVRQAGMKICSGGIVGMG
ncbi:MAG: biotin synthase BioB, partial [Alphaproteobacteria bacterium RIFOXYD12_FULL_60_8]